MIDRRRRVLLALPLLAGCAGWPANDRNSKMDKTGWKTHCFGRYLVDLPPDARVNAKYKLWDAEVARLKGYLPDMLKAEVDRREAQLKAQKHRKDSSMFLRRVDFGGINKSEALVSWSNESSKLTKTIEIYVSVERGIRVFRYSPEIDASKEGAALNDLRGLLDYFHSRADDEIPNEPGFCIDGAYVAGNQYMDEEFDVSVGFPKYPKVYFSFMAYVVGKPGKPLLERTGGLMNELVSRFAGLKVLRRDKHPVGPVPGEEVLTAGSEKGQRLYAFRWDFPGKADSLAEPRLAVEMGLLEQTPPPPTPPFKDDEEALQLWDAIVDSIRLRPGAV